MAKVFVGMSGGVDSSVSAALLKQQAHDVTGVFIKIWQPEFIECTWREDRLDAMRVCAALGIPYKEIDLSTEYKKQVVDKMVSTYASGKTPNPDVLCNREIKFGSFMEWARALGAEYVATGHYARSENCKLLRGKDQSKDQSYFLHLITKEQLENTIFPIGHLEKAAVRDLANKFQLPVAAKPDSQGLCFVGDVSLPEFLSRYVELHRGRVIDEAGRTVGEHDGAQIYTKGQRHGFRLAAGSQREGGMYVLSTDVSDNTITVSEERLETASTCATVSEMHWISGKASSVDNVLVQTRYRERPVGAKISQNANRVEAKFNEPHTFSSGQSLVMYDGDECLGGGEID